MGVSISALNTVILLIVYPGDLPIGPIYNFAAVSSMLLGIYVVQRFATERFSKRREMALTVSSTILGIITRVGVMSIVNWISLPYPYPIGFSMPTEIAIAWLPAIGVFNATLALYTIPTGYALARTISRRTKTVNT